MKGKVFTLMIAMAYILGACKNNSLKEKKDINGPANDASNGSTVRTGLNVEPLLKKADSLEVLYYDDPDGDSLRYTRFYTYTATSDTITIDRLRQALDQPFEVREKVKPCRSEGKIYLFKDNNPVKTVYFSTRCDTCCYVYMINNGNFMYFNMTEGFRNVLIKNKKLSKKI